MLKGEQYLRALADCFIATRTLSDGRVLVEATGCLEAPFIAPQEHPVVFDVLSVFLSLHMMAMLLRFHDIAPLVVGGYALPGRIALAYPTREVPIVVQVPARGMASGEVAIQYHFRASLTATQGPRPAPAQRLGDFLRRLEEAKEKEQHP